MVSGTPISGAVLTVCFFGSTMPEIPNPAPSKFSRRTPFSTSKLLTMAGTCSQSTGGRDCVLASFFMAVSCPRKSISPTFTQSPSTSTPRAAYLFSFKQKSCGRRPCSPGPAPKNVRRPCPARKSMIFITVGALIPDSRDSSILDVAFRLHKSRKICRHGPISFRARWRM